jgi:hypothetical protein
LSKGKKGKKNANEGGPTQ